MTVYVLLGLIDYEPSQVLGVFDDQTKARDHIDRDPTLRGRPPRCCVHDAYEIQEWSVGTAVPICYGAWRKDAGEPGWYVAGKDHHG